LIAVGGIKKPSYFGFSLLHELGTERLSNPASDVLVTRRADGTLVVAAWNLVELETKGTAKRVQLQFHGANPTATVLVNRADETHGNTLAAYRKLGSPRYPTPAQVEQINREGELPPEAVQLKGGKMELEIPPNGLVILELLK
jgi:xylan 1,4-beta-xylosidase